MQMQGDFTVKADREAAFNFLVDPEKISRYLPDLEEVQIEDENNFTVKAKVGISFIRGTMTMKLQIAEKHAPERAKVVGQGAGMSSVVDMVTDFSLEEVGAGETKVTWSGDLQVGGKLASFGGGGMMERVASQNLEKFVSGIQEGIASLNE